MERNIRHEALRFGDMVQADFLDTYRNLTLKAVAWMSWVERYCPTVLNLVKVDDDVVVNVFKLNAYLDDMHVRY